MKTDLLPFLNLTFLTGQEGIGRDRNLILVLKETDVLLLNNSLPVCKKGGKHFFVDSLGLHVARLILLLNSL